MAIGTVIGKYTSLDYVSDNIFGSWWFILLWTIGTATGIIYFIKRKVRRPIIVLLHLSFVIILLGALLTHLTAHKGMIHLRQGKPVSTYITKTVIRHNYLSLSHSTDSILHITQAIWQPWITPRSLL